MKPANIKPCKSIEYGLEHNDIDTKFKFGDKDIKDKIQRYFRKRLLS